MNNPAVFTAAAILALCLLGVLWVVLIISKAAEEERERKKIIEDALWKAKNMS
jgi:hypothetical protein